MDSNYIVTYNVAGPAKTPASAVPEGARHLRLVHAAQQFEAVMLSELMKPLSTSGAIGGEDPEKEQSNAMQGFGVESMAGALARSGALGFAKRIVAAVERDT